MKRTSFLSSQFQGAIQYFLSILIFMYVSSSLMTACNAFGGSRNFKGRYGSGEEARQAFGENWAAAFVRQPGMFFAFFRRGSVWFPEKFYDNASYQKGRLWETNKGQTGENYGTD